MSSFTAPVQHRIGTQNVKPQHQHDCSHCVFLGTIAQEDDTVRAVDLWFCPTSIGGPSYIQRFSSVPSDNSSMPSYALKALGTESFFKHTLFKRYGLMVNLVVARDILQETYIPHEWVSK